MNRELKKYGFTLAEVLLTLGIIGIIAAITIPTLIKNTNDQQYKAALKSAYSDLSQAATQIRNDNGGSFYRVCGYWADSCLYQTFITYFKNAKTCADAQAGGCWHALGNWSNYWGVTCAGNLASCNLWGKDASYRPGGMVLPDGTLVFFIMYDGTNCAVGGPVCGQILLDLNGFKPPNQLSKDIAVIDIQPDKLTPNLVNVLDNGLSKNYLLYP